MNDELTEQIFGAKSKDGWRNRVLSTEKPNPNSFFKGIIGEYKSQIVFDNGK